MNLNNNTQNTGNSSSLKPIFPPTKRPPEDQPLAQSLHKNMVDTPTHFETDYISMKWIPEKRRIDVIWKQFVSEDKVREVLLKEVAMIRHTKVKCLFLDAQKFKGTNPNIPRWANEVWSQMVHDAGLKHFATVVSDKDIFAVFSLKYGMGEKLTSLVNCAVFKTVEEGEVWLRQYTHPENPVYSDDELEEVMEEYEKVTTNFKTEIITEDKIEETTKPIVVAETPNEKNIKNEKELLESKNFKITSKLSTEKKQVEFESKNKEVENKELESEFEEEVEKNENSQIQVFSNFEDLEEHIQSIESKYKINEDNSDYSGN
jgi:hypothetical protein